MVPLESGIDAYAIDPATIAMPTPSATTLVARHRSPGSLIIFMTRTVGGLIARRIGRTTCLWLPLFCADALVPDLTPRRGSVGRERNPAGVERGPARTDQRSGSAPAGSSHS